ncbi:MAG: TonB-dependent receptor [Blastocatellales bacterium]
MPFKLFATLSLLLLLSLSVFGQGAEAVLTGTVTDPNGEAISTAKVVAHNIATGIDTNAVSNSVGIYLFPSLPPGEYRLTVEHTGFQKLIRTGLLLEVGARLSLDLALTIGSTTETVEVKSAPADTQLGYLTSSVGNVISGRKILDLPLVGRNAFDFIGLQAGVATSTNSAAQPQIFNGTRAASLNITLDGGNIQDNYFNGLGASNTANTITVDRIAEFRVVTSPSDAELGRGTGQIILVSRSGGNEYRGSLFHEHRNTALTSNTFFNNQRGLPREILIRNQYGGRIGGPIFKEKTFFHFHYEGARTRQSASRTAFVFTDTMRQGLFRFFPGAQNANANSVAVPPTVSLTGAPVRPATATGDLQTVSLYGRDPVRSALDRSGNIARVLSLMPSPNDFRFGDGLNTAGFGWNIPISTDFTQYDLRLDHNFSQNHRIFGTYSHQYYDSKNVVGQQPYPTDEIPPGRAPTDTKFGVIALTSALRPNLINEFRVSVNRPRVEVIAPFDIDDSFMGHTANNQIFITNLNTVTSPFNQGNFGSESVRRTASTYTASDTVTWLKGSHQFKGGYEYRFIETPQFDTFAAMPRALLNQGASGIQGINNTTIPGIGVNAPTARAILADLAGNVGGYYGTSNADARAQGRTGYVPRQTRYRHWRAPEMGAFFKDDWRAKPNLTLNLGVRYDWFAVPYEADGGGVHWKGGGRAIFGMSGRSFADLFQPGRITAPLLAEWEPIGGGTQNPDAKFWNNDNNNFSPHIGLSWSLPWLGKDKTVLRAGYSVNYERNQLFLVNNQGFGVSGYSSTKVVLTVPTPYLLTDFNVPLPAASAVMAPVPLTDRAAPAYGFDPGLRIPYNQNWSLSLQRAVGNDTVVEVRYVASRGRKLIRNLSINEMNIFENGFLTEFNTVRSGGQSALFNRMFAGLPGTSATVTGSDFLRASPVTIGFFAFNNPGGLANFLNITPPALASAQAGDFLRRAGLPENYFVASPQFAAAFFTSNYGSSQYDSLQVEVVKRFARDWTFQGNYTFSKAIGDDEGDEVGYRGASRTIRNRRLDRRLLAYHRTHAARLNGIYELPFGPGKLIGGGARGILGHIIGGWQLGGIGTMLSGQPVTVNAVNAFNLVTTDGATPTTPGAGTPIIVGNFPNSLGNVERVANGVVYLSVLRQRPDPSIASISSATIRGISTMRAITDANGNLLLRNPLPGEFGTLSQGYLTGPGLFRLDFNLLKRIKFTERVALTLRADAFNLTNTPYFTNPDLNINSGTFGRILGTVAGSNRVVTVTGRIEF